MFGYRLVTPRADSLRLPQGGRFFPRAETFEARTISRASVVTLQKFVESGFIDDRVEVCSFE